jgi:hypothetical protein
MSEAAAQIILDEGKKVSINLQVTAEPGWRRQLQIVTV